MQDVSVLKDGKLSDPTVESTVAKLRAEIPDLDEAAVEAQMMLFRAYANCFAALSARYEELGLSVPRLNTLRWLYYADDHTLTMTELSAHLDASIPSAMSMVQALARDGWVQRFPSKTDGRVTLVQLTGDGRERVRKLLPVAMGIWAEVWSGLSAEEKTILSHLLAKLRLSLLSRYIGFENLLPYKIEARKQRSARRRTQG